MLRRIHVINKSVPHHQKRRGPKKFVDILNKGTKKLVLEMKVSKVNKIENRRIKIAFKP